MAEKKGAIAFLAVVLFLGCAQEVNGFIFPWMWRWGQPRGGKTPCKKPTAGTWRIENLYPPKPGEEPTRLDAVWLVDMAPTGHDDIWKGTGHTNMTVPAELDNVETSVFALFDSETCVLSGTFLVQELTVTQTFSWKPEGEKMIGPYTVTFKGHLAGPNAGANTVELQK